MTQDAAKWKFIGQSAELDWKKHGTSSLQGHVSPGITSCHSNPCSESYLVKTVSLKRKNVRDTLPKTNSLPLKIGRAPKGNYTFQPLTFRGELLVSGRVSENLVIDHHFGWSQLKTLWFLQGKQRPLRVILSILEVTLQNGVHKELLAPQVDIHII